MGTEEGKGRGEKEGGYRGRGRQREEMKRMERLTSEDLDEGR
jgi:hypothetical protein